MAVLLQKMFPPTAGKSTFSYALSEVWHFYGFEKPKTLGAPSRILRDTGTETHNGSCPARTWTNQIPIWTSSNV
jgi:hypothetical protein